MPCGLSCEVYSRVVGFIRPIQDWNRGKQAEFYDRKTYRIGGNALFQTVTKIKKETERPGRRRKLCPDCGFPLMGDYCRPCARFTGDLIEVEDTDWLDQKFSQPDCENGGEVRGEDR